MVQLDKADLAVAADSAIYSMKSSVVVAVDAEAAVETVLLEATIYNITLT
jgi:hypothetical protein